MITLGIIVVGIITDGNIIILIIIVEITTLGIILNNNELKL